MDESKLLVAPDRAYLKVRAALNWRVRRLVGDASVDRVIVKVAGFWRARLSRPLFIGIAGSAGKTTTKELLQGILSYKKCGQANPSSLNALPEVAKTILRTHQTDDFCITELSEDRPGIMDAPLALLQPSIGIVTVVKNDHWSAFNSRASIGQEIGKLIAALPATGTAVLNADDELVMAMLANCQAKRLTYGLSPLAHLRAFNITSAWPDRLTMTLQIGDQDAYLRTQLCGTHWVPSVLGAIGGGLAAGLTLQECAQGIASVAPFNGRMQPVTTSNGVTFIRDDFKAPLWTVDACLDFMRAAQAKRKILVIGTLSDCGAKTSQKHADVALQAQQIADITIFVGPWASHVHETRLPERQTILLGFSHVREAAHYLQGNTRAGDLVLLKGTNKQDHLLRLILARTANVACWRDNCERDDFCNRCPQLAQPCGPPTLHQIKTGQDSAETPTEPLVFTANEQIIVGLGNPEPTYAGTPHNLGYAVLDQLADTLALPWQTTPGYWLARGAVGGRPVCLVKVRLPMNLIGAGLRQLAESPALNPLQCILVYDDLSLPIGTVRSRMNGGAGGHRGLASVLEAFQSDQFRRVKVGIGTPEATTDQADYVLRAFAEHHHAALNTALPVAQTRTLELVAAHPVAP
jgi:UDP-N-acetylmuramoyl-tripeptide--D-alanyl-D-alanine ligase